MIDWEVTLNFWTYIALLILTLLFIYKIVKISKELKDVKGKVDYIFEVNKPMLESSDGYIKKGHKSDEESYYEVIKDGNIYKFKINIPYWEIQHHTFKDNILKIIAPSSSRVSLREYKFVLNYDCSIATLINSDLEL